MLRAATSRVKSPGMAPMSAPDAEDEAAGAEEGAVAESVAEAAGDEHAADEQQEVRVHDPAGADDVDLEVGRDRRQNRRHGVHGPARKQIAASDNKKHAPSRPEPAPKATRHQRQWYRASRRRDREPAPRPARAATSPGSAKKSPLGRANLTRFVFAAQKTSTVTGLIGYRQLRGTALSQRLRASTWPSRAHCGHCFPERRRQPRRAPLHPPPRERRPPVRGHRAPRQRAAPRHARGHPRHPGRRTRVRRRAARRHVHVRLPQRSQLDTPRRLPAARPRRLGRHRRPARLPRHRRHHRPPHVAAPERHRRPPVHRRGLHRVRRASVWQPPPLRRQPASAVARPGRADRRPRPTPFAQRGRPRLAHATPAPDRPHP